MSLYHHWIKAHECFSRYLQDITSTYRESYVREKWSWLKQSSLLLLLQTTKPQWFGVPLGKWSIQYGANFKLVSTTNDRFSYLQESWWTTLDLGPPPRLSAISKTFLSQVIFNFHHCGHLRYLKDLCQYKLYTDWPMQRSHTEAIHHNYFIKTKFSGDFLPSSFRRQMFGMFAVCMMASERR